MNQEEVFLERWKKEKASYDLWGKFVRCHVYKLIQGIVDPRYAGHFVRIPAIPRVKEDDSLLQKAFHRGKNYKAPFDDIEDKVGIRFVLLLGDEVRLLRDAILAETDVWRAVKARDYDEEIAVKPYEFDYQSLHFVVRSIAGNSHDGSEIPEGLPCEIQVRTLLQHAYSEVSHDTLYKPKIQATSKMRRAAAKSMALLEATGDYFEELNKLISEQVAPLTELSNTLCDLYEKLVGVPTSNAQSPLNNLLLDRYGDDLEPKELEEWLSSRAYIGERINERRDSNSIYRLPAILLLYYSVSVASFASRIDCPISDGELELIYGDLGKSLEG